MFENSNEKDDVINLSKNNVNNSEFNNSENCNNTNEKESYFDCNRLEETPIPTFFVNPKVEEK